MKIGIVAEGTDRLGVQYEGIWRVMRHLVSAFVAERHDVTIYHLSRHADEVDHFIQSIPRSSGNVDRVQVDGDMTIGATNGEDSSEILAEMIFLRQTFPDAWLNPNPMWKAVQYLPGPKISFFHDFLIYDYPCAFIDEDYERAAERFRGLSKHYDKLICTSRYVLQRHAVTACSIPPGRLSYIPNPPIDYSDLLDEGQCEHTARRNSEELIRTELKQNLGRWLGDLERKLFLHHTQHYPFKDNQYLFVSTQNRPHKQVKRVAQALQILLRERFMNLTVFTTALMNIRGDSDLEAYLLKKHLCGDFLSVGKVSDRAHAALYKLAALTVHPSPFEGNFPLPFAESVSVGTPCIVPFSEPYLDFIPGEYWDNVFYDDTPEGLADKINYVLANREEVLGEQQKLLAELKAHTWRHAARAQLRILEDVIARSRTASDAHSLPVRARPIELVSSKD